jgi:hypothetical protein
VEKKEYYDLLQVYRDKLRAIQEEYIGMDGFEPETAPEAYLLDVLKRIYRLSL